MSEKCHKRSSHDDRDWSDLATAALVDQGADQEAGDFMAGAKTAQL
jgi:hypothetical protein